MSKVQMGMKKPLWAKITTETAGALPTYATTRTEIGEAIAGNLTVNTTSGELYSNDTLNIRDEEFLSGTLALETDGLDDEVASDIFGATSVDGLVTYAAGDVAPHGGLAYYTPMKDKTGKKYFRCYFYPKVQAVMGGKNSATKAGSITFQTASTNFTVYACESGAWMLNETLETEAEAAAWCEEKLGKPAAGGGN